MTQWHQFTVWHARVQDFTSLWTTVCVWSATAIQLELQVVTVRAKLDSVHVRIPPWKDNAVISVLKCFLGSTQASAGKQVTLFHPVDHIWHLSNL